MKQTPSTSETAPVQQEHLKEISFFVNRLDCYYSLRLEALLMKHKLSPTLRPGMGPVLFALFQAKEGMRIKELGAVTDLAPSSITELLQRMEKRGLIKRSADKTDGRAQIITLTPKGRSLEPGCRKLSKELNEGMESPFSSDELTTFKTLWWKLIHHLMDETASVKSGDKQE